MTKHPSQNGDTSNANVQTTEKNKQTQITRKSRPVFHSLDSKKKSVQCKNRGSPFYKIEFDQLKFNFIFESLSAVLVSAKRFYSVVIDVCGRVYLHEITALGQW